MHHHQTWKTLALSTMLLEDPRMTTRRCIGDREGHSMLVIYLANTQRILWTALADNRADLHV